MPRFRMVRTSAFAAHIVCLALFAGCKSSTGPSSSTYSATFSANGSTVQYTTQSSLLAAFAQASTQYDCIVSAFDASSSLSLQMYDGSAITAKAYSGYNVVGGALVGSTKYGYDYARRLIEQRRLQPAGRAPQTERPIRAGHVQLVHQRVVHVANLQQRQIPVELLTRRERDGVACEHTA